jgi:hypothetical protein
MKNILASFFLFILPLQAISGDGPIGVGNGGGSSEYSIVFTHNNLVELLNDCANFSCTLDREEHIILWQIINYAVVDTTALKFGSTSEVGNALYKIVLDTVWVNQDLLWIDSQKTIPYSVGDALGLWVTILADRYDITNPLVKTVSEKVAATMQQNMGRGKYDAPNDLTFEFVQWNKLDNKDLLVIRDPFLTTVNVSELIANEIQCTDANSEVSVFSPSWIPIGFPQADEDVILSLDFGLRTTCGVKKRQSSARIIITAKRNEKNELSFDLSSTILQVR